MDGDWDAEWEAILAHHAPEVAGGLAPAAVHRDSGPVAFDVFRRLPARQQAAVEAAPAVPHGDVSTLAALPRAGAAEREG